MAVTKGARSKGKHMKKAKPNARRKKAKEARKKQGKCPSEDIEFIKTLLAKHDMVRLPERDTVLARELIFPGLVNRIMTTC